MGLFDCLLFFSALLLFLGRTLGATSGDADPIYKTCVEKCEKTGCIEDQCLNNCNFASDKKKLSEGLWYHQEPFYLQWRERDCYIDCRYYCMLWREEERIRTGEKPIKYHGKWPLRRLFGIQEPVAVALSTLNLTLIFHGWVSFFILVSYKLPLSPNGKKYYEFTGLWHVYGILSMTSWFWSAVFHARYVDLTERLYYSSTVAFLGFALIMAIIRTLNVTTEAARVMLAAPLIAFVITHILYLNVVELNYGLNLVVVSIIATATLLIWATWAGVSSHPSRWKLWVVAVGSALAMLLEIIDFPPYRGLVDGHALWLAITAPLTYIWWSFVRDDAVYATSALIKKAK